jgi:hypothetical protein
MTKREEIVAAAAPEHRQSLDRTLDIMQTHLWEFAEVGDDD